MGNEIALIPFSDLQSMAQVMGKTGMFGKSPDQLLSLMLIAQAEGIHPAIAAQEYDIIQGKPAINSRAALSRFQAAGGSIQWVTRTAQEATAVFSHPQGGQLQITWTMARADQAGLTGKDNWKKYPEAMLSARVVAEGVRAIYPAALSRLYTVEEVQDFDAPKMPPMRTVEPEKPQTKIDESLSDPMENLKGQVKEAISRFVNLVGTQTAAEEPYFTDEEKAFYKQQIAAINEGAKAEKDVAKGLQIKLADVIKLNKGIEEELKARQGNTPLANAVKTALQGKNDPEQKELY